MSNEKHHKLVQIKVTPQTFFHLRAMAKDEEHSCGTQFCPLIGG